MKSGSNKGSAALIHTTHNKGRFKKCTAHFTIFRNLKLWVKRLLKSDAIYCRSIFWIIFLHQF